MNMFRTDKRSRKSALLLGYAFAVLAMLVPTAALAAIDGITAQSFNLTARDGYISLPEGGSVYSWGYSLTSATLMQFPGPTMIVSEGDAVTVELHNALPAAAGNVSIVFPGQVVTPSGGVEGALTQEAPPGGTVTYTFTPTHPGTYQYHSGTRPDLQVEMGLVGALIVTSDTLPAGCAQAAYNHPDACFDRETLFLLSEIDMEIHQAAELQKAGAGPIEIPEGPYQMEYWLINGRAAPDTLAAAGTSVLPTQPYNCFPMMHPGERVLLRIVGAGRERHPFHHHGNHSKVIARDGNLLLSETDPLNATAGPTLFTIMSIPGGTSDSIFEWTGKELGWDIYGTEAINPHTCKDTAPADGWGDADADYPWEWCADHDSPIPVDLPNINTTAFGGFWSGSPYLGLLSSLPPGEGGLNPSGGFTYVWHSHTERELVNNDVFPGGMLTILLVVPADVPID